MDSIFIKDNCRGYGVRKALVNEFKLYCKSKDINNLMIIASGKNIKVINFYKKNGTVDFYPNLIMNFKEKNNE